MEAHQAPYAGPPIASLPTRTPTDRSQRKVAGILKPRVALSDSPKRPSKSIRFLVNEPTQPRSSAPTPRIAASDPPKQLSKTLRFRQDGPAQPRLPGRVTASNPPVQQVKAIMLQKDKPAQPPRRVPGVPARVPGGVPEIPTHVVAVQPPEQKSKDRTLRPSVPEERHGALEATHRPPATKKIHENQQQPELSQDSESSSTSSSSTTTTTTTTTTPAFNSYTMDGAALTESIITSAPFNSNSVSDDGRPLMLDYAGSTGGLDSFGLAECDGSGWPTPILRGALVALLASVTLLLSLGLAADVFRALVNTGLRGGTFRGHRASCRRRAATCSRATGPGGSRAQRSGARER
ncbi:hypothetical protein MTO96_045665 [Rhipicephalus appendiculatus]